MPKISQGYPVKIFSLPSYKGSEVHVKTNLSVDQLEECDAYEKYDYTVAMLERMIVKWDIQEDDGTVMEISIKNLRRLPAKDLTKLMGEANKDIPKKADSGKTK